MSFYLAEYKFWRVVKTGEVRWMDTRQITQKAGADATQARAFSWGQLVGKGLGRVTEPLFQSANWCGTSLKIPFYSAPSPPNLNAIPRIKQKKNAYNKTLIKKDKKVKLSTPFFYIK